MGDSLLRRIGIQFTPVPRLENVSAASTLKAAAVRSERIAYLIVFSGSGTAQFAPSLNCSTALSLVFRFFLSRLPCRGGFFVTRRGLSELQAKNVRC